MKTMKKILSVISAGIMAIACATTAFAENAVISSDFESGYDVNVIYEGNKLIVYGDEDKPIVECVNKKYDFTMNYVILHNDGIVTAEWFGLSDEYTVEQTAYDDKTETYTVNIETYDELKELYDASKELLENGVIENAYKQYTYEYNCWYEDGYADLILKEEDKNFNPNSIEGLEDVEFIQSGWKCYTCEGTLENVIALDKAQENIFTTKNVQDLKTIFNVCAYLHTPKRITTYLAELPQSAEITLPMISGDANNDGFLNVRDCSHIAKNIAAGTIDELKENSDYNKDGKVNIRDAAALANYLISLYDEPIDNPTV